MPVALTLTYQHQLAALRTASSGRVGRAWSGLGSYDESDVPRFVRQAVPVVLAGQRQAVRLTNAYLARLTKGQLAALDPDELVGASVRNGADPAEVYRRPFVNVWTALSKGVPWALAVAAGLARATSTADMDVALSTRAAASAFGGQDDRISGFQRVPDANACDFCLEVAGQRYSTDQLMPCHNRCGCTVEPIVDGRSYSQVRAPGDDSADVAVHEHGELGPVLTNAEDHFTSEHELD